VRDAAGAIVLVLDGEFDFSNVDRLVRLADELALEPCSNVLVDASGVTFASAALLGALNAVRTVVLDGCGTMTIRATSGCMRRILEITNLDGPFGVADQSPAARDRRGTCTSARPPQRRPLQRLMSRVPHVSSRS